MKIAKRFNQFSINKHFPKKHYKTYYFRDTGIYIANHKAYICVRQVFIFYQFYFKLNEHHF